MVMLCNMHNSRLSTISHSIRWITRNSNSVKVDNFIVIKRYGCPLQSTKVIHRPVDNFIILKW